MFERFTDRARRVVVLAQEEARLLHHNYIGTEHLLLGLIHEGEGVAAQVLDALGHDLAAVRRSIETIVGEGGSFPSGHLPFTARSKKVLELALREALQLGHNYIGTEHVLLALIREGEGIAAQVLTENGTSLDDARKAVITKLASYEPPPPRDRTTERLAKLAAARKRVAACEANIVAAHADLIDSFVDTCAVDDIGRTLVTSVATVALLDAAHHWRDDSDIPFETVARNTIAEAIRTLVD